MTEEWRRCPNSPYRNYEISSEGRVRRDGRELVGYVTKDGYRSVLLSYAGISRRFRVNRLVCEAFHGPGPPAHHAAHLDGQLSNNRAANLAWKSAAANNADKRQHGTHQAGAAHPRVRLTPELVGNIKESALSSRAAAIAFGVSQSQIVRIRNGKRWAEGIAHNEDDPS